MQKDHPNKYREQIASAISWELIYQLMRRFHTAYDLRVFETHPGGGLYDCLSLYSNFKTHYFDFNLEAQSLHIWKEGKYDCRLDIVNEYLRSGDPKKILDRISKLAGLKIPKILPSSAGSILACGFVASIFKMNMFGFQKLKMLMSVFDTSDGYGNGIRFKEFEKFPAYKLILENITKDDPSILDPMGNCTYTPLYKYFFLKEISSDKTLCLVDMTGLIILSDGRKIMLEKIYLQNKKNIDLLTGKIVEML